MALTESELALIRECATEVRKYIPEPPKDRLYVPSESVYTVLTLLDEINALQEERDRLKKQLEEKDEEISGLRECWRLGCTAAGGHFCV